MLSENGENYTWVKLYSEIADKLLSYKNNRKQLIEKLIEAHISVNLNYSFKENNGDMLDDICPFTVFGCFNKGIKNENRIKLLGAISRIFGVKCQIPSKFDGIPVLMNTASWFFAYKNYRLDSDIPNLWDIFEKAIFFSDHQNEENKIAFSSAYDKVKNQQYIKWNLSMGLYWIRANSFLNLDSINRTFLLDNNNALFDPIRKMFDFRNPPDSRTYLMLIDECKELFIKPASPFKSFYELSYQAWIKSKEKTDDTKTVQETISKPVGIKYWICSPGENASKWDEFYSNGIIGINWDNVDDLTKQASREDIRIKMKDVYGDAGYRNDSLALWQFSHVIQTGDIIYAKQGKQKVIGRGIVESDYIFDSTRSEFKHIRKVRWTNKGEWVYPGEAAMKTLTDISSMLDVVTKLESMILEENVDIHEKVPEAKNLLYTDDNFLSEVFMIENDFKILKTLLKTKKNLILQGAPGVGKTFIAKRLAYTMMGEMDEERIKTVQFHQSYSYEDFMLGFRPEETNFKLTKGPFYEFCKKAEDDFERDYFFIIDEINRGNLGKIFGEMLMLIELDKRGERIQPLYSKELFSVPKNIHIIGMMNTADRSIALIDYALRRRFAFFELLPAFDSEGFTQIIEKSNNPGFEKLVSCVMELNQEISKDETLGKGFQIGHSYLCKDSQVDDAWLYSVVLYELIPLITEYWFDAQEKAIYWSEKLKKAINDKD